MPERRCQEHGCDEFPDAAWAFCAAHLAEREERMKNVHAARVHRDCGHPADVEIRRQS